MIKTNLKKDSEKHNCSNDIHVCRAHAWKQKEGKQTSPEPSLQPSPEPSPEPVEPDLALHQRFPEPSPGPSLQPSPEPVEADLALHHSFLQPSPEPSPEPSVEPDWLGTKASQTFSGTLEPTLALHQSLPDLLRNRLGFAPRLPGTFSGIAPESRWTWPGSAPKPPRPSPETSLNLTRRLHQCTPELFWAEDPMSLSCWGINI